MRQDPTGPRTTPPASRSRFSGTRIRKWTRGRCETPRTLPFTPKCDGSIESPDTAPLRGTSEQPSTGSERRPEGPNEPDPGRAGLRFTANCCWLLAFAPSLFLPPVGPLSPVPLLTSTTGITNGRSRLPDSSWGRIFHLAAPLRVPAEPRLPKRKTCT